MSDALSLGRTDEKSRRRAGLLAGMLAGLALCAVGWQAHLPQLLLAGVARIGDRPGGGDAGAGQSGYAPGVAARPSAGDGPVPPTRIGISLTAPGGGGSFANMALGSGWTLRLPGWHQSPLPAAYVDKDGNILDLPRDAVAFRNLTATGDPGAAVIRCTFTGKAKVQVAGPTSKPLYTHDNELEVSWDGSKYPASLIVGNVDPAHPPRDFDCRRADMDRSARFTPDLLRTIKGFRVLRFMDWQNTNADLPIDWAHRHSSASLDIDSADGVPLEDMIALATLNGSDAWFNMPSRADDDYVRRFARYVHDHLQPGHKVYVEYGNEVWNWGFPVSRHTYDEGAAAHLGGNAKETLSLRYAERLVHVMDIWAGVFADNPARLVRVAAGQAGDIWRSGYILGYKDLSRHVDAFAIAPYFDYDRAGDPTDLAEIFRRIDKGVDRSLDGAAAQKALAYRHGLRLLAYEAGQGIVMPDVALNERIQRDPRMHDAYDRYLDGWRARIGDTIILFGTVFKTRSSGAWGLLEYAGQPASEAPKFRAAHEQLAR